MFCTTSSSTFAGYGAKILHKIRRHSCMTSQLYDVTDTTSQLYEGTVGNIVRQSHAIWAGFIIAVYLVLLTKLYAGQLRQVQFQNYIFIVLTYADNAAEDSHFNHFPLQMFCLCCWIKHFLFPDKLLLYRIHDIGYFRFWLQD